ncbi:hypothetical protein [Deinococcus sp.]|uniref:hypothetical protein n=1 Tax=Deinococcus sp. TaxID=47478 RepID=UPI0025E6FC50|nr:hypothetical protein [Deinococcus sp.]
MTEAEFEEILQQASKELTDKMRETGFATSKSFENGVRDTLEQLVRPFGFSVNYDPHPHVFPDITVGKFGVEVKFTEKDTWRSVANSIQESRRDVNVKYIYLMFGKMGAGKQTSPPEVRWAKYEESVIHVRTSHMPRFEVQIGGGESLFKIFGLDYASFSDLSVHEKMAYVRKYARDRKKPGERMWWLEDRDDQEHSLSIQARLYTKLSTSEKRKLRAEATLLCPQIFKGSRESDKYDDAVLFILTYHGVLCHQARDLFTAGSVSPDEFDSICGGLNVCKSTMDIQDEIIEAARRLDGALITEYWEKDVPEEERLAEWLKMADSYASTWQPSVTLTKIVAHLNSPS